MPITFIGFSLLLCYHMHHHHQCNITFCGSTVVSICRSATLDRWNVSITVRWFALKPRSGVSRRFDWMIPLTFLLMHHEVNICGFGSKVTTTIGLTAMMSAPRKLWCIYSKATALYSFLSACSTIFLGLVLSLMTTIQVQFEQRGLDQFLDQFWGVIQDLVWWECDDRTWRARFEPLWIKTVTSDVPKIPEGLKILPASGDFTLSPNLPLWATNEQGKSYTW